MPETVGFNCSSIEDVSPYVDAQGDLRMEVTLADVEVDLLIQEVGMDNLLCEMKEEDVMQYFEDRRKAEEE